MEPHELTPAEHRLYESAADGRTVDLTGTEDRTVRATALASLLHDPPPPSGVPGLRLRGAHVTGELSLYGTAVDHPVVFTDCAFDEAPRFTESTTGTLQFLRCTMPGLDLARLRLTGVLSLAGSTVAGRVDLNHAQIDGELSLSGAHIGDDPEGRALTGESLRVTGLASFNDGFTATGSVCLPHARFGSALRFSDASVTSSRQWSALQLSNAQIEGTLTLRASTLVNPGGVALAAGGVKVDGGAWLNGGFGADGDVRFIGATLLAHLTLGDARLRNSSLILETATLSGLHAQGLVIEGGQVRLVNARLTGDLDLTGARLAADRDGTALNADGVHAVTARLNALTVQGRASMIGARIEEVCLDGAELGAGPDGYALRADRAAFGTLSGDTLRVEGRVSLRGASVTGDVEFPRTRIDAGTDDLALACDGLRAVNVRLAGLTASGLVSFDDARLTGELDMNGARLEGGDTVLRAESLTCGGVRARGLHAAGLVVLENAQVTRDVELDDAVLLGDETGMSLLASGLEAGGLSGERLSASGRVSLRGARLAGDLVLSDARVGLERDGHALTAEGLNAVNVRMSGLQARGMVTLRNSTITSTIRLGKASLESDGVTLSVSWLSAAALWAPRLTVRGQILLRGSQVAGEILLEDLELTGNAAFPPPWDETYTATGHEHPNHSLTSTEPWHAITADGLSAGALLLTRAKVEGEVTMRGARIIDRFDGRDARFRLPSGVALRLSLADITGDVFLRRARIHGMLRLSGTRIGRDLQLNDAVLHNPGRRALEGEGMHAGRLVLRPDRVEGAVRLNHARVGVLEDDGVPWSDSIEIDGLVYESLEPRLPPEERLDWLVRDPRGFQPQPYEQLANHYAALGQQHRTRTVLLARERCQGRDAPLPGRWWSRLQDLTVGYGYQPLRAATWLVIIVALGSAVFWKSPPEPLKPDEAPHFTPIMYTMDLLLPIVDLGQEHAFNPEGLHQWFSYLLIATGWILATTIAASAARVVGRR